MYRYVVDNAVTYTSEDLVLFRESPFACWMERLTLENPDHGIPPDLGSRPPGDSMERQDELAETLRTEGKQVALIDWEEAEPERRRLTLDAMRKGEDFIVNGQLALGPLSGSANLLMRTSGFSELGNYLYLPCDTQTKTTMHSAFRLCFLADLLHSLQGQLPGQMLIIRGGSDLLPLTTEDHIYHYLAVKQRFMAAMREFRKHRMPDPAESSQFGRWSECANEVIKQRALHVDEAELESSVESEEQEQLPEVLAVAAASSADVEVAPQNPIQARLATARGLEVKDTLATRARALQIDAAPSAPQIPMPARDGGIETPAVVAPQQESSRVETAAVETAAVETAAVDTETEGTETQTLAQAAKSLGPSRRAIDTALEDLSFIGRQLSGERDWPRESRSQPHPLDSDGFSVSQEPAVSPQSSKAPAIDLDEVTPGPARAAPQVVDPTPVLAPQAPDEVFDEAELLIGEVDAPEIVVDSLPVVDEEPDVEPRRVAHPSELAAAELEEMEVDCIDDSDYRLPPGPPLEFDEPEKAEKSEQPEKPQTRRFPFSSSLKTSGTDRD